RVPAGARHRRAAGLSGRGKQSPGAAFRRIRFNPARYLFRLSRRAENGGARAGVSRFRGEQGAALAVLTWRRLQAPDHRMTDMRLTQLPHGANAAHNIWTLSIGVTHLSPSSSGANAQ